MSRILDPSGRQVCSSWSSPRRSPIVIPFMLMADASRAIRVSHLIAIVMLFGCGFSLGRHLSWRPVRSGIAVAAIGVLLVAMTIALGG